MLLEMQRPPQAVVDVQPTVGVQKNPVAQKPVWPTVQVERGVCVPRQTP